MHEHTYTRSRVSARACARIAERARNGKRSRGL
jgi:hypothetical protein